MLIEEVQPLNADLLLRILTLVSNPHTPLFVGPLPSPLDPRWPPIARRHFYALKAFLKIPFNFTIDFFLVNGIQFTFRVNKG
jgi:hypothetical protein